jgi:hypothetical protein
MAILTVLLWAIGVSVLFILLSPGMLLTIPVEEGKNILTIGETKWLPVVVHALVFGAIYGIAKVIAWALRRKRTGALLSSASQTQTQAPAVVSVVKQA